MAESLGSSMSESLVHFVRHAIVVVLIFLRLDAQLALDILVMRRHDCEYFLYVFVILDLGSTVTSAYTS